MRDKNLSIKCDRLKKKKTLKSSTRSEPLEACVVKGFKSVGKVILIFSNRKRTKKTTQIVNANLRRGNFNGTNGKPIYD